MAHLSVVRRSMSLEQWAKLQCDRIDPLVIRQRHATGEWQVRVGQYLPEGYTWDHDFVPIRDGDYWGRPDGTAEFVGTVEIPASMAGQPVWFSLLTAAEVIVYCDGRMLDGLDPNRSRVLLTPAAQPGQQFEIRMEAYVRSKPDDDRSIATNHLRGSVQTFRQPELVVLNEEALALKYDLQLAYSLAFGVATPDDLKARLQQRIERMLKVFPPYDCAADELLAALPAIKAFVRANFYQDDLYGKQGRLACVAHSHLDIAYYWKVAQTVQKNARTCLIQLRLMDRYPDFKYAHTQAWTYETLERYYPALFEEVRRRVAEGRWEIIGGMYVEPDCNLPSAESFARQILYGKRYFSEKFGVEVDNCWLPDVFGNSAILPQLLKAGGIDYFVSNKMSTWNDTNRFPHSNFAWRGIDGSEVYACVPPVHFISWMAPDQVLEHWQAFHDQTWCDESLHMYGYGDGGSGITDEMLESIGRLQQMPGVPRLRLTTGKDYLHAAFAGRDAELPTWDGELYLEMHRGTFTSRGRLKRENRQGEFLAQEVETLCTLAALRGMPYPRHELAASWKKLLLNQFHDILPGSHTQPVFFEAERTYAEMRAGFERLKALALDVVAPPAAASDVWVMNMFGFPRGGSTVVIDAADRDPAGVVLRDSDGEAYAVQRQCAADGGTRLAAGLPEIAALSSRSFTLASGQPPAAPDDLHASPTRLESRFFRLEFDASHRLVSIFDKLRHREVLPAGAIGNEWQFFEDKPGRYNAWDLLANYKDHPIAIPEWEAAEVVEQGPLSVALRLTRAFSASRASQVIRLHADIPRIDFETHVDWHETERLLKVAFPVTVRSRFFTTDTSAGGLERENHCNTSWQQARFEVCAHKWVDLSEGLFGVALLNDCKYGVDVADNVLRLSLLRAPIRPDRHSDKGAHDFTYSLFTHDGDWRKGGLVEAAYHLNWPLAALAGRRPQDGHAAAVFGIDHPALACMAVKMDEDGAGDVILRTVELYGAHGTATIRPGFACREAWSCDLLERPVNPLPLSDGGVRLAFRPYEIRTLRFVRQPTKRI